MARRRIERTNAFTADSEDGTRYIIHEFTEYNDFMTSEGSGTVEVLKSLKTADGSHVNRIEKGVYQIVGFDIITLRSDDENAP